MSLLDIVKEQGVVDIIEDYIKQINHMERFNKYREELKDHTKMITYDNFDRPGVRHRRCLFLRHFNKNGNKYMKEIEYEFINDKIVSRTFLVENINPIFGSLTIIEENGKWSGKRELEIDYRINN